MAFDLATFRNNMAGGGARPTLFEMQILFPGGATDDSQRFLTKISEIPGSTVGVITVPYFGRQLKIAGDRTFATLTCTIINDENYSLRKKFEAWMRLIARHDNASGASTLNQYQTDLTLNQLQRGSAAGVDMPTASYTFTGAFPTSLGTIALDWSSTDTIEEYTVEFQYQYWESLIPSLRINLGITFAPGSRA
jgi:hypothetical protein